MKMKKTQFLLAFMLVFGVFDNIQAQLISESAKKKVTVGADVYTDIWMNVPDNISTRTINQGANVFLMYNLPLSEKVTTFAVGLGFSNHNMYGDFTIDDIKADSIVFKPIPSTVVYQKSKMALTTIDLPLELKFRFNNDVKIGLGFKMGYVIDSKTKYVGDIDGTEHKIKDIKIENLQKFTYGATFKVGYKFFNLFANYQISKVFEDGKGPDIYPISVGITITPF